MELMVTKTGRLMYDEDFERLADQAEAGGDWVDGKWVWNVPAQLDPPMDERPTIQQIIEAVMELHKDVEGDEPETRADASSNRVLLCADCDVRYPCDTAVLLNGKRRA